MKKTQYDNKEVVVEVAQSPVACYIIGKNPKFYIKKNIMKCVRNSIYIVVGCWMWR